MTPTLEVGEYKVYVWKKWYHSDHRWAVVRNDQEVARDTAIGAKGAIAAAKSFLVCLPDIVQQS